MREALPQRPLADVVDLVNDKIVAGKDPAARYVGLENLVSGSPDLGGWSPAATSISTNGVFREGDTLFGKLRPNLRKCVLAPFDGYCSTDILVLRAREGFAPRFASRVLQSSEVFDSAVLTAIGTKMPRTSWHALRHRTVFAPPLPEQRQIAAILDTLDDAIRKTGQIIAKLKQVKQGLLHDLLTRGIDDNGELRDPERHPEQFKESALGRIPKAWSVESVGNVLAHVIDYRGRTPRKLGMDWGGGDIPALSANNVKMGGVDLNEPTYYGSETLYSRWMTNGDCEPGDVLMTMEAPLGNVAQIPDARRYILSQRVVLYRFSRGRMLNDFAAMLLRGADFQAALVQRSTGTTATGIQRAAFVQMPVSVPGLPEQMQIADAVAAADRRIQAEVSALRKLVLLKRGLMEDLLTGRVRVTTLLENASP
jgi:type I restriction enzyme S subunit